MRFFVASRMSKVLTPARSLTPLAPMNASPYGDLKFIVKMVQNSSSLVIMIATQGEMEHRRAES